MILRKWPRKNIKKVLRFPEKKYILEKTRFLVKFVL